MKCYFCYSDLEEDFDYCLVCGNRNHVLAGLHISEKIGSIIFAGKNETGIFSFRLYDEWESIRNTVEFVWEKFHRKRAQEILISGEGENFTEFERLFRVYSLYQAKINVLDNMSLEDFKKTLENLVKSSDELEKVELKREDKIGGAHSTIIGGREGRSLVLKLAESPYVKKIVPGIIENKGTTTGSVRLKLTRSDEKGNLKALLIHGGSVQQIHVITTARNKEEGELLIKLLKSELS